MLDKIANAVGKLNGSGRDLPSASKESKSTYTVNGMISRPSNVRKLPKPGQANSKKHDTTDQSKYKNVKNTNQEHGPYTVDISVIKKALKAKGKDRVNDGLVDKTKAVGAYLWEKFNDYGSSSVNGVPTKEKLK